MLTPRRLTAAMTAGKGGRGVLDARRAMGTSAAPRRLSRIARIMQGSGGGAAAFSSDESGGISSDDEARREARPPKRVRLLTRAARELECETTEAEQGDDAT